MKVAHNLCLPLFHHKVPSSVARHSFEHKAKQSNVAGVHTSKTISWGKTFEPYYTTQWTISLTQTYIASNSGIDHSPVSCVLHLLYYSYPFSVTIVHITHQSGGVRVMALKTDFDLLADRLLKHTQ